MSDAALNMPTGLTLSLTLNGVIRRAEVAPQARLSAVLREGFSCEGVKIRCDACPVLCFIAEGRAGACDRYANVEGVLTRVDPLVILDRAVQSGGELVSFLDNDREWDGESVQPPERFLTAVGAGTTYPDFKPAPFIVSSQMNGVDMVTVVTEGIFSYCGVKLKIDTDRHLGNETAVVRYQGEAVGHVTTGEYGSQMMSLGGVLSEHQAGKLLDLPPTGIKIKGQKSTPGRYFRVAEPGQGWGGTDIDDPLTIIDRFDPKFAKPGMKMLMVSTTGDHAGYFVLDEGLNPVATEMPDPVRGSVLRVQENCEPALCSVVFIGGAGGSLRAGVTENPVKLTRSVRDTLTYVTSGGAAVYIWPGGGITYMVDVTHMPENSFGYVPDPALVAPIEFTMRMTDYEVLGGHMASIRPLAEVSDRQFSLGTEQGHWPVLPHHFSWNRKA